jgi:gliding motility-associated-like protein
VVTRTNASCSGNDGSITIGTVTGGTAPYTYSINGGAFTSNTIYTNLNAGNYSIAVKDATGCIFNTTATITSSGGPTDVNATATDAACGATNGSVTIGTVTGGSAPYTYSINGGAYSNTTNYTNLGAGTYSIAVKDANGCVFNTSVTINSSGGPTAINITASDASCAASDGSLVIESVTGGVAPYTYSINNGNFTNTTNYQDLAPGTYTVTVKDANGCVFSATGTINAGGGSVTLNVNNPAPACGYVDLTAASIVQGSEPGLTYSYWLNPEATTPVITPSRITASGTYYIKAVSTTGCFTIKPVTVVIDSPLDPDVSITSTTTSVCNNAVITFTATSINAGSNPTYQWKVNGVNVGTNSTKFSSSTLKSGDVVSVVMTSNAACTTVPQVTSNTITLNDELVTPAVTITASSTSLCDGTTIIFTAVPENGGDNPSYQWRINGQPAGTNSNTFSSGTLKDGDVISVVMTSSAGCTTAPAATSNEIAMTANPVTPQVTIEPFYNSSCEGSLVTFTASPQNGGNNPTYQWRVNGQPAGDNSNTFTTNSLKQGDVVTVEMTSSATCVTSAIASSNAEVVKLNATPTLVVNSPVASCGSTVVNLTDPSVTAGSEPGLALSYWTDPAATTSLADPSNVSISGTYYIMATKDGGCSIVRPVTVTFQQGPTVTLEGGGVVCSESHQTITLKFTGTAPFSFTYSDGTGEYQINSIVSNTYNLPAHVSKDITYTIVSVTDASCTNNSVNATAVFTVEESMQGMRYDTVRTFAFVPTDLKARQLGIDYTYKWQPDLGLNLNNVYDPVFNWGKSQDFTVALTSPGGCVTVDTVRVNVVNSTDDIRSDLYVPNAWSPNGDGKNDELYPFLINIKVLKYFRVFNRWGQLMFEIKDYTPSGHLKGWDGIWNGTPQVLDVYTWTAEAEGVDGRHFKKAGNAMLLR